MLFTMLWWESVAPLGLPVVPDVNWMLVGSSLNSDVTRQLEEGDFVLKKIYFGLSPKSATYPPSDPPSTLPRPSLRRSFLFIRFAAAAV